MYFLFRPEAIGSTLLPRYITVWYSMISDTTWSHRGPGISTSGWIARKRKEKKAKFLLKLHIHVFDMLVNLFWYLWSSLLFILTYLCVLVTQTWKDLLYITRQPKTWAIILGKSCIGNYPTTRFRLQCGSATWTWNIVMYQYPQKIVGILLWMESTDM